LIEVVSLILKTNPDCVLD